MKAISDKENIAKRIAAFGNLDLVVLSGMFVDKETPIDLLLVGDIDRRQLEDFFAHELESKRPVRFSIMGKEEYLYRRKCKDRFISDILEDPDNIVSINKLEKEL